MMPELSAIIMHRPDGLQHARADQPAQARRQPAERRGDREQRRPEKIDAPETPQVAQPSHRQDEPADDDQVRQLHPGHLAQMRDVEVLLDDRDDDVDGAAVHRRHHQDRHHRRQDPPAVRILSGCQARFPSLFSRHSECAESSLGHCRLSAEIRQMPTDPWPSVLRALLTVCTGYGKRERPSEIGAPFVQRPRMLDSQSRDKGSSPLGGAKLQVKAPEQVMPRSLDCS